MAGFASFGYALAALLFTALTLVLLTSWRGRLSWRLLVVATSINALWAALAAIQAGMRAIPGNLLWAFEVLRNLAWLFFLLRVVAPFTEGSKVYASLLQALKVSSIILAVLLMFTLFDFGQAQYFSGFETQFRLIGHLAFSVVGLVLVEQLFRNTPHDHRWGMKYLCLGLGGIFVFDFYMYTDALLFQRIDPAVWSARGIVTVMAVPLIGFSAARNPRWSQPLLISRSMVFHSTALFGAGVYMLLMAFVGYYIKIYGGQWGAALQIAFFAGALILLLILLFSGQMRARAKVFLSKHFFSYKYDYRNEWLRLIGILSGRRTERPLQERVILAIGEIVESEGGLLWQRNEDGRCHCVARFNHPQMVFPIIDESDPLLKFLSERHWIVNVDEYYQDPSIYEGMALPYWLQAIVDSWLVVPLIHDESLRGFVVLKQPRAPQNINWESMDLLKTAGMQAASYLTLNQAAEALAEARQFEGFNRLSAFVMHDLKNLVAQLSLVAKNAARHKNNPEFIDDAVHTIENSVGKMNRLMAQLKTARIGGDTKVIDMVALLRGMVEARRGAKPEPSFSTELHELLVRAESDRLSSVIGHIVQNAQDATPVDGVVEIKLRADEVQAIVEVRDTGQGMDEEFMKSRLFRPFDSTKGLTGMGIGAYECREFIRGIGGQVEVESVPGRGTQFLILIPLVTK